MSIKLRNIKCYEDVEYNFGNNGLILISGNSGKGKSTILQAIYFALFGSGSKITMVGKNSCSVEFNFDGIKIFRSKNPCKLVVNDIYEEDHAQQIINNKFGSTFDVTGYIPQNAMKSFAVMSSSDKLSFLERFAFENCDLTKIKSKCKDKINAKNTELIAINSKFETTVEMFEEIEEPEFIEFPVNVVENNYKDAIQKEFKKHALIVGKVSEIKTSKYEEKCRFETINKTIIDVLKNNKCVDELKVTLQEYNEQLNNTGDIVDNDELQENKEILDIMSKNKQFTLLKTEYESNKVYLEKMILNEVESLNKRLTDIDLDLWLTYTEEEVNEMIETNDDIIPDLKRLKFLKEKLNTKELNISVLKNELEENKKLLNNIKLKDMIHSCPSCNARLRFNDGNLVAENTIDECLSDLTEDDVRTIIFNLETNIKILTEINSIEDKYDEVPDIKDTIDDLKYLREYYAENKQTEKLKTNLEYNLENKIFSESCKELSSKVEMQRNNMENMKDFLVDIEIDLTEDELCKLVNTQQNLHIKQKCLLSSIKDVEKNINRYLQDNILISEKIVKDRSEDIIKDLEDIKELCITTLSFKEHELIRLEKLEDKHKINIDIIKSWETMMAEMEVYNQWQKKVSELQSQEEKIKNEYAALNTLKDKILEAESLSIINIVETINTHASIYLKKFFEDEPITVRLKAFKNTKKITKAQITMDIQYKGIDCDINMMSGGETSRIILAYTLALAEMFNTPMMLLDECTASLDQETADDVFEAIRDHFNGKLTIIIAHQVVTGTFDNTINL